MFFIRIVFYLTLLIQFYNCDDIISNQSINNTLQSNETLNGEKEINNVNNQNDDQKYKFNVTNDEIKENLTESKNNENINKYESKDVVIENQVVDEIPTFGEYRQRLEKELKEKQDGTVVKNIVKDPQNTEKISNNEKNGVKTDSDTKIRTDPKISKEDNKDELKNGLNNELTDSNIKQTELNNNNQTQSQVTNDNQEIIDDSQSNLDPKIPTNQQTEFPSDNDLISNQPIETNKTKLANTNTNKYLNKQNIASKECGAKILEAGPEVSHASSALNNIKDEYMNMPCTAKEKWFIIETCEPVLIRSIQLANHEMFSSKFKTFKLYTSDRYPVKHWYDVGTFMAVEPKELQTFDVNDKNMVKYVKFEFLDYYGSEHYCPLTFVRILGKVVIDDDDDDDQDPASSNSLDEPNNQDKTTTASGGILTKAKNIIKQMVVGISPDDAGISNSAVNNNPSSNINDTGEQCGPDYSSTSPCHILEYLHNNITSNNTKIHLINTFHQLIQSPYYPIKTILDIPTPILLRVHLLDFNQSEHVILNLINSFQNLTLTFPNYNLLSLNYDDVIINCKYINYLKILTVTNTNYSLPSLPDISDNNNNTQLPLSNNDTDASVLPPDVVVANGNGSYVITEEIENVSNNNSLIYDEIIDNKVPKLELETNGNQEEIIDNQESITKLHNDSNHEVVSDNQETKNSDNQETKNSDNHVTNGDQDSNQIKDSNAPSNNSHDSNSNQENYPKVPSNGNQEKDSKLPSNDNQEKDIKLHSNSNQEKDSKLSSNGNQEKDFKVHSNGNQGKDSKAPSNGNQEKISKQANSGNQLTAGSNAWNLAFMRMKNMAKQLELNVSVSMQYLDRLSENYKSQTDRLKRTLTNVNGNITKLDLKLMELKQEFNDYTTYFNTEFTKIRDELNSNFLFTTTNSNSINFLIGFLLILFINLLCLFIIYSKLHDHFQAQLLLSNSNSPRTPNFPLNNSNNLNDSIYPLVLPPEFQASYQSNNTTQQQQQPHQLYVTSTPNKNNIEAPDIIGQKFYLIPSPVDIKNNSTEQKKINQKKKSRIKK